MQTKISVLLGLKRVVCRLAVPHFRLSGTGSFKMNFVKKYYLAFPIEWSNHYATINNRTRNTKTFVLLKEKQPYNDMKHTSGIALPKSVTF